MSRRTYYEDPTSRNLFVTGHDITGEFERQSGLVERVVFKARHFCGEVVQQALAALGAEDRDNNPPVSQ